MFLNAKKKFRPTKKIFFIVLFVTIGLFCLFNYLSAQESANLRIFYQGALTDSKGNPVEDGRYNMRFAIYDSQEGGNILWQEEYTFYNAIFVKDGKFQVILGRKNPINLDFEQGPYWLGVAVGEETELGEITWNIGIDPRKKIVSLSQIIEEEGLTNEGTENISKIVEEKLGKQPGLVVIFNLEDIEKIKEKGATSSGGFSIGVFQDLLSFISEKISWIADKLSEIGEKINEIITKLEGIKSVLVEMSRKIDVLYNVLVADKGLVPQESPATSSEEVIYTHKKVERLILKGGEKSVKIFNESIKKDSLIFVSFLDEPGSAWWISEKAPGEFTISLRKPAPHDLTFNYWILNEVSEKTGVGASEIINPPVIQSEEEPVFTPTTSSEEVIPPLIVPTSSANSSKEIKETTSSEEMLKENKEKKEESIKEEQTAKKEEATSSKQLSEQEKTSLPEQTSSQPESDTSSSE